MVSKSLVLLLLAATLVLAQEQVSRSQRERQLAADRRSKLFEQRQAEQQSTPASGQRRRLVSRTRVNSSRSRTTEAPTATTITTTEAPVTTTEEPVATTEPVFETLVITEQPEVQTTEPSRVEFPAFRPRTRPVKVQEVVQESAEVVQEEVRPVRVRPQAGPVRTRSRPRPAVVQAAPPQQEEADVNAEPVQVVERPRSRPAKTRDEPKPIVETIRRYSFENDDGSFTFGYENADGSFKEETRGADCIVRGKYGYVDPDGVKREFTYQAGNPCNRDEDREASSAEEEDERPVLPQRRPNIPTRTFVEEERRPVNTPRPSVQTVQERPRRPVVNDESDEEAEINRVINSPTRISRPVNDQRVQQRPQQVQVEALVVRRPVERPQPVETEFEAPVVRRPVERPQPVETEFQAPVRRPVQPVQPVQSVQTRPVVSSLDFDAEVQRLAGVQPAAQQRPAPRPVVQRPIFNDEDDRDVFERRPAEADRGTGLRSFTSELVFDRNTNQFQTAFQQRIPETNEEISLREKLIGFVPSTTTARSAVAATTLATPVVIPVTTARPLSVNEFFGPSVEEQERLRQEAELRRQQAEAQRLREERQRIQEENERRSRPQNVAQTPANVQQFNPNTFGFNPNQQAGRFQQPQFNPQQQQFAPQQQPFTGQFQPFQNPAQQFQQFQQNPFAPGLTPQRVFQPQQQQPQPAQFRAPAAPAAPVPAPAPRPVPTGDRPTFALGQIDSFLSSLSG